MISSLKLPFIVLRVLRFAVRAQLIRLFVHDPDKRRELDALNTSHTAKFVLDTIGFRVRVTNPERLPHFRTRRHLIVSNHVSYLDILIISSICPTIFITSEEMGRTPILGQITRMGGCLYTDRTKYVNLPAEIAKIAEVLKRDHNVVLFPEGTSTNGDTVMPFRKSLFEVVCQAGKPIQPLCIKYLTLDGEKVTLQNRDHLYWYGDMFFVPHFPNLMKLHAVEVEVTIADEINWQPEWTRQQYCDGTYQAIRTLFDTYPPLQ